MAKISSPPRGLLMLLSIGLLTGLATAPGCGEEAKKSGLFGPWVATAELSYVVTGGNQTRDVKVNPQLDVSFLKIPRTPIVKSFMLAQARTENFKAPQAPQTSTSCIPNCP